MTDKKRRPMMGVLCEPDELKRWHSLARRRRIPLSTLVRLLLEEEAKRQEVDEARRLKLEKVRPAEPKQIDLEDALKGKAAHS